MKARTRRRLQFGALGLVVFIAITTIAVTVLPHQNDPQQQITYTQPPRATGADWDGYLMDATNSAYNQQEKTLSPQMMAHLRPIGMFDIGQNIPSKDAVSSSVVSVGNTLYFGSWDGYEYAVNATTFALRWRQFLGITTPPAADQCFPASAGVSSNALISGDNLYVGGGAGSMYDLDPTTGTIIWQTKITTPPDGYIWGSPLLAHGRIYIGTSSYGDCPLIRASIDMLDAATGQLLKVHYTVGPNEVGNSIWSKGVLDAADHAVIFATGNGPAGDPESQAIVALNWDTLDVIGTWAVPKYELGGDSDFGSSCLLVPDVGGGRRGVVCHNKNGYLYAVAVSPTGLSLSWALKLGRGGDAPEHDMGDINESVFDGKYLYAATETMTDDEGHTYASAVYKIDPATATILWVSPINNFFSLNALAGANGFLVMGLTDQNYNGAFIVISTATGAHLYQQILSSAILFAPSIADGEILLPTLDGHLYIYSEVSEPTATANLASKTLPVGWKWLAAQPGRTALTGQGATITAGAGTTVENNLLLRSLPVGDFTIEAPIAEPLVDGTARAGIVAYASPGNYVLLSILTQDGQDKTFEMLNYYQNKLVNRSTIDDPIAGEGTILLQLVQMPPNRYIGYTSRDGTHWLKVGDFTVPFSVTLGGVDAYAPDRAMIRPATFAWCQITSLNGQ